MTQKFTWFAALALLLAFGVNAVRAEEEQEEIAPPAGTSAEVLAAPTDLQAAPCCKECGSSCACCSKCCTKAKKTETTQYTVTLKMVKANSDGDCDVILTPTCHVFEGQAVAILVHGEQTPMERRDIGMQIRVTKQDQHVRLDLAVENHIEWSHTTPGEANAMTSACHTACNVMLGKMKRVVLTKNRNGSDADWIEATVTESAPSSASNNRS